MVVMDQEPIAKATEIEWKHTFVHANVMGTFHTTVNLLASNGRRFQDIDMRDICTERGIIVEGTISDVSNMEEYMYNRAVQSLRDGRNTSRI